MVKSAVDEVVKRIISDTARSERNSVETTSAVVMSTIERVRGSRKGPHVLQITTVAVSSKP